MIWLCVPYHGYQIFSFSNDTGFKYEIRNYSGWNIGTDGNSNFVQIIRNGQFGSGNYFWVIYGNALQCLTYSRKKKFDFRYRIYKKSH